MSTDGQELSPAVQREAIRAYASEHGFSLVAAYEDEGRSGLTLKGRPGLQRLIADVTQAERPFEVVLVYDISRWGRFEDTDASAYYEYHCRLHGVNVVYVKEPFPSEISPLNTLLKGLKRAMAAEYSRELKIKSRAGQEAVIQRGFQMGKLPCIGFRRMSVAADGSPGRLLADCERKPMHTDRVRWVVGPPEEVALVQRIFRIYTETSITIKALVAVLAAEGERDSAGKVFSYRKIRTLLSCEAFAGTFIWGRRDERNGAMRRLGDPSYTRVAGALQPLVPQQAWELAQQKRGLGLSPRRSRERLLSELRSALTEDPTLGLHDLPGAGCATEVVYKQKFGSFTEALRLAGLDTAVARAARAAKVAHRRNVNARFRADFIGLCRQHGIDLKKLPRSRTFLLPQGPSVAVHVIRRRRGRHGLVWQLPKDNTIKADYVLVVRMEEAEWAQDFLLLTRQAYWAHPPWFLEPSADAIAVASGTGLAEVLVRLCTPAAFQARPEERRRIRYTVPLAPKAGGC